MFTTIVVIVVVLVGVLLGVAAVRPDTLRVERATDIRAAPDKIFALINDLQKWGAWSPYEKKDPAMKRTFGSVTSGKGATYAWDGNKEVGKGSMTIADAVSPASVTIDLHFEKPMEGRNTVIFSLQPQGNATHLVWSMFGPATFMSRVVGVFINMDNMIGRDFEAGLANLKAVAEK